MKPSPIQLLRLTFKRVSIELDPANQPAQIPNPLEGVLTFDGVTVNTEVGIGDAPPQDGGSMFFLELRLLVDNRVQPGAPQQKFSPYLIDIAAEAIILVPKGAEKLGPPEDLAIVNGAGLMWSAIREQVLNLTSRMRAGPVMLPTVHFHDLKSTAQRSPQPTGLEEAQVAPAAAAAAVAQAAQAPRRRAPRKLAG
ncbi:MAG TPA: hypothetical protein PK306_04335 [Aquabacterium sp.]|nr:hypothetical protein [Aquabacterium sp.]HQC94917.1 hypothetical protein [Aquabacterium sp.]